MAEAEDMSRRDPEQHTEQEQQQLLFLDRRMLQVMELEMQQGPLLLPLLQLRLPWTQELHPDA